MPISFASEAWPRPGLAEPRSASLAGFGFFHQHIRKGKVVITKTSKEKRLLLGSFLAPETDMIFGDGVGASPVSYSLSRSSSSSSVVSRWIHRCRTAPSMCNGHPAGICDSSRSPSPFCSIMSPSIGTSIEVLRLIRGRLHCHVSGESKPRLASSATAGKEGWSLMIIASSLIMSRRPCMGSGVPCPALGGGPLVAVVSWNQVGRTDLTLSSFLSPCF